MSHYLLSEIIPPRKVNMFCYARFAFSLGKMTQESNENRSM